MKALPRSLAHLFGVAIGIAGLAFVGVRLYRDWDEVEATLDSARIGWLIAAVSAGLASMTVIALNWLSLIRRRGHHAPHGRGLSWFFTGQLGKYVPGGIWPVVGQAELAGRGGADRRSSYLATVSSMAFTLLAAITVAAISGVASPHDRRFTAILLTLGLVVMVASLAIPRLRATLGRLAAAVTRGRAELPEASVVVLYTLRHIPVWVMFGVMYICVFVALGGDSNHDLGPGLAVDLIFAASLSWIVGFVVIGVPGGIGVRESVFVALMTAPIGATLALSVAVAARLVTIAVDLLGALAAAALARFSRAPSVGSVRSPVDVATDEADHPDPVLQRGSDVAPDGRRPAP
jgi:glycosyltransferase 2 family protein